MKDFEAFFLRLSDDDIREYVRHAIEVRGLSQTDPWLQAAQFVLHRYC